MADDVANGRQRAYDEQPSALTPLEQSLRRGLEKIGPHTNHPGLRAAAYISSGEKLVKGAGAVKRAFDSGKGEEALLRGILLGSEVMGIDTDVIEGQLDGGVRGRDNGSRPPRGDSILTGPFDP